MRWRGLGVATLAHAQYGRDIGRFASVKEFTEQLFAPRSWGSMAESETYAHLEHLRLTGEATVDERGGQLRYSLD